MTPDQTYALAFNAAMRAKEAQGTQTPEEFARARDQSVTQQPNASKDGLAIWTALQSPVGPILPPWGTRRREYVLRLWDRHEYNTLWQGAASGLIKRVCATDWVMQGGKILANKYQRVFLAASSGEWVGWSTWLATVFREYLRQDGGAWIEVVGPGDPRGELTGGITGLNVLVSYNCWPTGDPDYPCVYWSRVGTYNLMHRSRVIHLVDMPDGDVLNPGYGLCALSRAIAVVQRQFYEERYIADNLNDVPSSGVVIAENITPQQVDLAYQKMEERISTDEPGQPGKVLWVHSMNPTAPADLKNFTFSRPPEKFDWDTYMRIDVNSMALAIGEDPQDLWPLSSSSMGSGQQSEILAKKGKGKMYGHFLKLLERELNSILPESLEFTFKITDPEEAKREAEVALAWAQAIVAAGNHLSVEEGRRILANNSEQIFDVVTDEKGELVELPDVDVHAVNAGAIAPNTDPALPPKIEQAPTGKVTTDDAAPNQNSSKKDYEDTASAFVENLMDLFHAGLNDDVSRRRAGVVMRGQLNSSGKQARNEGLKDGGVDTGLSDKDLTAHAAWLAEQSGFVTDFLNSLYKSGLTDVEVQQHAEMWATKSLQKAYYEGVESADADGMFEFVGQDGKENCETCRDLKGEKMRMSEWSAKELRPGVDTEKFICGGWNCKHYLKRVTPLK